MTVIAAGLLFGLSLIVAVGPQNSFVIRQGIRRENVLPVVAVCTASDIALIAGGTGGAGAVLDGRAGVIRVVGIVGVAFLLGYGVLAARRALRPQPMDVIGTPATRPNARLGAAVAASLAFTWLNPAVYVDTVFVVGPVSQSHGDGRWWFALGAAVASALWFAALGFGARLLAPVFVRPAAWRVLDASVAVIMLGTAVRIAVRVW